MTVAHIVHTDTVHESFRAWKAERESLDSQLSDSLAALSAYQSHLDGWQERLAKDRDDLRAAKITLEREQAEIRTSKNSIVREQEEVRKTREQIQRDRDDLKTTRGQIELERDEVRAARQQIDRERTTSDKSHAESSATMGNELNGAREKITALTTLLLNRTEELRTLDNKRAEVQTELELSRARERELKAALDEHNRSIERERSEWAEELKQLREVLERQLDSPVAEEVPAAKEVERPAPPANPQSGRGARAVPSENAVLGSIVEQFGKLRQQRAVERQAVIGQGRNR